MRRNRARRITSADLVAASGVAPRTLAKHFKAFVGVPPLGYLARLRLAAAREALLGGAHGRSVTDVAIENGFTHLGRFSVRYRRQFGEAPSATLKGVRTKPLSETEQTAGDTRPPGAGQLSRERPSLAILPWPAFSSDPAHRWFAEGIANAIATALTPIRSLCVLVPRRSPTAVTDAQRAARETGARYVMVGQLTTAGPRIRLLVRIAESATGAHVWGDSYDGDGADLFALQDRLIAGIARAVLPNVRSCEIGRAQRTPPRHLDAGGLALRAIPFVLASRPAAAERALDLLQRAMEIDPDYALAAALAAWCRAQLVMYNGSAAPADDKACAVKLADRAALLDADDPLVLTARCLVLTMVGEFEAADGLVARALQLEPSSPCNGNNLVGIATAHFGSGRYEEAAAWTSKALREQPQMQWANRTLAASYARLGEQTEALRCSDTLRRYAPGLTVGQVLDAVPFRQHHLDRLGEALHDLGLPD
jgi:adenylate cyclase